MEDFVERAFTRQYLPQWLVAGGVALLIMSGIIWWNAVYMNPYNVYWGMLNNSLSTSSVTKHITQDSSGTKLDQYIAMQFGTENYAYGRTVLTDPSSVVTTESIGTIKNDYIRYTSIKTTQKSHTGKNIDFTKVLGKWAKADAANTNTQTGSAPFFIQSVIGIEGGNTVPIANLTAKQRDALLQLLHESVVFDTTYSNIKKQTVNGRPTYTYSVNIEPVAYVAFEKVFAADLGIKTIANLDPENYQSDSPIKAQFVVDARSHRLNSVIYQGASHTETYASYGVPVRKPLPKATISDAKLQQLLISAQ